ncbi:tripartite tricarboxylate transporter substrate binding protein [Variovorax terrae]|uniref:Tripartite tricarboxylate transporter substrate binding protein n=1 Tax=Variovorax terrae TaxID=2923278 RepID=A0A9X1VU59_9BURK|nr:tripartite tricarboxylate transporter substrate binding protein [Variovorax terrae]MCJ0763285.1 tripartite tricarboxylate transporter substrate binding protein [Variovorax terrae]
MERRQALTRIAGLAASGTLPPLARGQSEKALTLVVPYPPGGGSDILARAIQPGLQKTLGQTVIVENLAGANGSLAARKVLNAAPDGNTLLVASPNEVVLAPLAMPGTRYTAEEFRMINLFYVTPLALYARTGLTVDSVDSLIALARIDGTRELPYGTTGVGSMYHVVGENFRALTGTRLLHVPYKGGGPLIQDLIGQQIDLTILPVAANLLGMVDARQIKILGVATPQRSPMAPNVPTFDEGKLLKGFHHSLWFGTVVPAKTPEGAVRRLHQALAQVVQMPETRAAIQVGGAEFGPVLSLTDAARFYASENARIRRMAKGVKLES